MKLLPTVRMLAALCAVIVCAGYGEAVAGRLHRGPSIVVWRFQRVAEVPLSDGGRYAFFPGSTGPGGAVLDERTGRVTLVPAPPGCRSWGGPWMGQQTILYSCAQFESYDIPSGRWTATPESAQIAGLCFLADSGGCGPVAVGRDWIKFQIPCYHCAYRYYFERIGTGRTVGDPRDYPVIADLDSPRLAHRICRPLEAAPDSIVAFERRFALIYSDQLGGDEKYGPFALKRCGARLDLNLGSFMTAQSGEPTIAANTHAIISLMPTRIPELREILLPSLKQRLIHLPPTMATASSIVMSSGELWVATGPGDTAWKTRVP